MVRPGALLDQPARVRALRYGFLPYREKVIAAPPRPVGRLSSGNEPAGLTGAPDMFTDIWTARDAALDLARTLMVATIVIAVGSQYAVITADDLDSSLTIVSEYDPFG